MFSGNDYIWEHFHKLLWEFSVHGTSSWPERLPWAELGGKASCFEERSWTSVQQLHNTRWSWAEQSLKTLGYIFDRGADYKTWSNNWDTAYSSQSDCIHCYIEIGNRTASISIDFKFVCISRALSNRSKKEKGGGQGTDPTPLDYELLAPHSDVLPHWWRVGAAIFAHYTSSTSCFVVLHHWLRFSTTLHLANARWQKTNGKQSIPCIADNVKTLKWNSRLELTKLKGVFHTF